MTDWVIGDTHFGHEAIIRYCNRPFKDAAHMDREMIERWNSQVNPGDLVYHVGDVFFKGTKEQHIDIMRELNGTKVVTLGNHDPGPTAMRDRGFMMSAKEIVISCAGYTVLLNHYPKAVLPYGINLVIHGHIHNSTPAQRALHVDEGELVDIPDFNINVSVEMINYMPVPLDWLIKQHFKKRAQSK